MLLYIFFYFYIKLYTVEKMLSDSICLFSAVMWVTGLNCAPNKIQLFSSNPHSNRHLENIWGHTPWSSDERIDMNEKLWYSSKEWKDLKISFLSFFPRCIFQALLKAKSMVSGLNRAYTCELGLDFCNQSNSHT